MEPHSAAATRSAGRRADAPVATVTSAGTVTGTGTGTGTSAASGIADSAGLL